MQNQLFVAPVSRSHRFFLVVGIFGLVITTAFGSATAPANASSTCTTQFAAGPFGR